MIIPQTIPQVAPQNPIKTDSSEKSRKIFPRPMPRAFCKPISLVRSITAITKVLIIPNEAASNAINAKKFKPIVKIPIAS